MDELRAERVGRANLEPERRLGLGSRLCPSRLCILGPNGSLERDGQLAGERRPVLGRDVLLSNRMRRG
jgi:hypothetical protein